MSEVSSYRPGTPSWADLTPSDPAGARAFYGELFGWDIEVGPSETEGYGMCRLRGKPVAGILGTPQPDVPVAWTTYLATDDVEATCARATEVGGVVLMGPMSVGEEGRMAVALDPTGAAFGLWQAGNHIGAAVVNEPGSLVWTELSTPDVARARQFYVDLFGYSVEAEQPGDEEGAIFRVGDRPVANAFTSPAGDPPAWGVYFHCADTPATLERAVHLGAGLVQAPIETPLGTLVILTDPQGASFSLVDGEPDADAT